MGLKITFLGAARTTTGSMHLVEANGVRILLDCGLYQGHRKEAFEKNRHMPVDPKTINYVILSHAHIDHSGNLPQLVRNGFRGKVFARQSTCELSDILLRDSCFLQKRDLEYVNKKRRAQGKNLFEPLYEEKDVDALAALFEPVHIGPTRSLGHGVSFRFHNAGHILGSAIVELLVETNGRTRKLVFSGDLGQPDQPILRHYEYPENADILLVESTYADRLHPPADDVGARISELIKHVVARRSKLLIPAFSVGRTQQIIWHLNRLAERGELPPMPVYVDSPLSQKATRLYAAHREVYNAEAAALIVRGVDPLTCPGLKFIETPEQSMALNTTPGPMIIIAASGMCEGGRVVHHLKQIVGNEDNVVLICGFQAENTLGRRVVEKVDPIKVLGEEIPLKARVEVIGALSAHADRAGLIDWISHVKGKPGRQTLRYAFAVHGEPEKVEAMAEILKNQGIPNVAAPVPGQIFTFD